MNSMLDRTVDLILKAVGPVVAIVFPVTLWAVFFWVPTDAGLGLSQRIFYYHMPGAVISFVAFALAGVSSLAYLRTGTSGWDHAASSAVAVGMLFATIVLATGSIWARTAWGTWWTWDARLTSTLFIFLLFVGYLIMRDSVIDPDQRARFSAVIGIMGLVLVPFIHLTVYLFRTLHPDPTLIKPSAPSMPGVMLVTLLSSMVVFILLYVGFLTQRYAVATLQEMREEEMLRDS